MLLLILFAVAPPVPELLPPGALLRLGSPLFRHGQTMNAIACSLEGKRVATCGGEYVRLWDGPTGAFLREWKAWTFTVAFSPDGRHLLGCADRSTVIVWDVITGAERLRIDTPPNGTHMAVWSPSSDAVVYSTRDGGIVFVSLADGQVKRTLRGGVYKSAIVFDPTGRKVAGSDNRGNILVWDVGTGAVLWQAPGHARSNYAFGGPSLAYTSDGATLVSAGMDGTVRTWSAGDGKPLRVLALGERWAYGLMMTPDGHAQVCFNDRTMRTYDLRTGKEVSRRTTRATYSRPVPAGDAMMIASGLDLSAPQRWDRASGRVLPEPLGHLSPVTSARFLADGRLISLDRTNRVIDWKMGTARELGLPEGYWPQLTLSPDGRLAAWGSQSRPEVTVTDAGTGARLCRFDAASPSYSLGFSPERDRLVTHGIDGCLRVWGPRTGKLLSSVRDVGNAAENRHVFPARLAIGPAARIVVVMDSQGNYRAIDTVAGKIRYTLPTSDPENSYMGSACLDAKGHVAAVATGMARTLVLWDTRTGEVRRQWPTKQSGAYCSAFSPDGRLLATASDYNWNDLSVWEVATGTLVRKWGGPRGAVRTFSWSADGRRLASGAGDTFVFVWDVTGGAKPGKLAEDWGSLAAADATRAFDAACRLGVTPGAAAFLAGKLKPVAGIEPKAWAALLDRMDSDDFATRERAVEELKRHGCGAIGQARAAVASDGRLEVVRRLKRVIRGWEESADRLREGRAVMALEWAGAADALKRLAGGAAGADLTEEARAALDRLR